ncbi:hypothetical protein CRG98_021592 [Punica granatum]|uniref:F-box domain-containing protein n=1 Tax=Punica granatum TaxID=22663 RepID=A0A2I0JP16_PUNGR|nr:hypothetical protein CRG98_021592 [Punica granatum]
MKKNSSSSEEGDGAPPLPQEIIVEILLRLPVKSLCRFRCVSPLWRSIISDPQFVSSHFACSSARKMFFSTDYPENSEDLCQVASYHGRITTMGYYIQCSAGGLICINAEEGIKICNPSTAECITFPNPPNHAGSFLGYDPVEKKHKILKFTFTETEMEILTLGEKEWRRMNPCLLDIESFEGDSLCIEGVLYLIGRTEEGEAYLVAFDVRLESFRAVPLPEECEYYCYKYLMEFGGCVALVNCGPTIANTLYGEIRACVLDDLHKQVWSCKDDIPSPHLDDTLPIERLCVGVTHAGELAFAPPLSTEPFCCYLYHMKDASLRKIEISGLCERISALTDGIFGRVMICSHVESLQSLGELRID